MPSRYCQEPRCPNLAVYRGRCHAHTRTRNAETRSENKPLYNSKHWKVVRKAKLSRTPICEQCDKRMAAHVHHRIALQDGGRPWDWDNLESLCHSCHSQATRQEQVNGSNREARSRATR